MTRRRISPRLVALLVYALAVNAVLWAQTAIAAFDARHTLCGPMAAATSLQKTESTGAHVCCDLACAVQGVLAPPVILPLALPIAIDGETSALTTLFVYAQPLRPYARGPPVLM
jgi:hypothetical protein